MNYSFNSRVRYSETGENGKLTLPGVLNYFQDCCTFHAEKITDIWYGFISHDVAGGM